MVGADRTVGDHHIACGLLLVECRHCRPQAVRPLDRAKVSFMGNSCALRSSTSASSRKLGHRQ